MTATSHSLVGASIACLIPNPLIAIPLAFASNFILDTIPHWDVGTGWHNRPKIQTFVFAGIDVLLGLSLSFLIFAQKANPLYLLLMIFVATFADWAEAPYLFLGWDIPPFNWFYKFQSKIHHRDGTLLGIMIQVIIVLPLIILAYTR